MTMRVTYTDRNNNIHTKEVDQKVYCQLVASLVWTKGEIKNVEHISQ